MAMDLPEGSSGPVSYERITFPSPMGITDHTGGGSAPL